MRLALRSGWTASASMSEIWVTPTSTSRQAAEAASVAEDVSSPQPVRIEESTIAYAIRISGRYRDSLGIRGQKGNDRRSDDPQRPPNDPTTALNDRTQRPHPANDRTRVDLGKCPETPLRADLADAAMPYHGEREHRSAVSGTPNVGTHTPGHTSRSILRLVRCPAGRTSRSARRLRSTRGGVRLNSSNWLNCFDFGAASVPRYRPALAALATATWGWVGGPTATKRPPEPNRPRDSFSRPRRKNLVGGAFNGPQRCVDDCARQNELERFAPPQPFES